MYLKFFLSKRFPAMAEDDTPGGLAAEPFSEHGGFALWSN